MRAFRGLLAAAVLLLAVGAPLAAFAATADESESLIKKYLKIRSPRSTELLPDGSILTIDRPEGVNQLYHTIPAKQGDDLSYAPGVATTVKLTDFPDGISSFSVSPDGSKAILMHAPGGNEYTGLTLLDLPAKPGAPMKTLLSKPRVQANLTAWLKDGSGFFYSANDDSPKDFNAYRWDFAAGKATRVVAEPGAWFVADATRDGKRALVVYDLTGSLRK